MHPCSWDTRPLVAVTSDEAASCYFLEGGGYEEVLVISLLDMMASSIPEFQAVIQKCIAAGVSAGKRKLVVDLQANGGGYVMLGYDFSASSFRTSKEMRCRDGKKLTDSQPRRRL